MFVWIAVGINLGTGLLIILADIILLLMFRVKNRDYEMDTLKRSFQRVRDAAGEARTPALGIYLLCKQLKMTDEEILAEYEKDWGERKLIVQSVTGKDCSVDNYFLNRYMSRFMQYGYAEEGVLITALRARIAETAKKDEEKKDEEKK
ncbi:unnamed protein product, partial [Mesorhabditis spiculigera]